MFVLHGEKVHVLAHAPREGDRSVYRVDEPAPARLARLDALLLADDPVSGVAQLKLLADEALGLPVGFRHRRAVALPVDVKARGAEVAESELARPADERDSLVQRLGEGLLGCSAWFC